LFISLFTFAEPIELTLSNGATWNGNIGDRVELITKRGRKSETIEGILINSTERTIVVELISGRTPIMNSSIESIITLAVSDDLQTIENNDDKEIATPSIEIDLAKLFWLFCKEYRFDYFSQKSLSSHPLKVGNTATQISQPMIQPVIQQSSNRYAVIDLSGSFGEIEKLPNRTYSRSFITACTLEPAFKEIKKQAKKIRHVVFLVNSTGGDKGAIFDVGQLLDDYSTDFTYYGVVVNTSTELSPLFGRFANTYSLNSKVAPNSVSSVADIGRKLGLQEWVEIERVSSYADKQRLTRRKRILFFIAEEEKLFLSLLQYKNTLEQASLSLKEIYNEYERILGDENTFLDASIYEKNTARCYEGLIKEWVSYETGYFSTNGKNKWDNNWSSLARRWDSCCKLVNSAIADQKKVDRLQAEIISQKQKYDKRFDCITVKHQTMRNEYMDNINDQLTSVFVNLQNQITRLANYHVLPCFRRNEVLSKRGNYPEYYVKPPCSGVNPKR